MKRFKLFRRIQQSDRGSALLVSLMVIVGLSLLGLGFVAISETESAISKNQQSALQTQAIAEAGARVVVEWFQNPTWGINSAGMPQNSAAIAGISIPTANAIKTSRTVGTSPNIYTGVYKPTATKMLFDKPYRPGNDDRLWGDEDHADVIINRATNPNMVDAFNNVLLASNGATASGADKQAGEVTEIKVYAPPIVGGTLTNGFWSGGQRYGVATIKVTAQQFRDPANHSGVIASHAVRLVVGELPLPIPAGPIQGNANVAFGGNFRVHWGMETATGSLTPSLNLSALPWANAYERPHFEHGYETGSTIAAVIVTNGGSGYTSAPTITIGAPCATGGGPAPYTTAVIPAAAVTVTNQQLASININAAGVNRGHGYIVSPPTGYVTPGGCTNGSASWGPIVTIAGGGGSGATALAVIGTESWPISGGIGDDAPYLPEVLAKDFQDPFYGCRSVGDNTLDGVQTAPPYTNPQLFPYIFTSQERSAASPSYAFQWQYQNVYPQFKRVIFPSIRYDYWKRIAEQGRGYRGIYYFKFDQAAGSGFKMFGNGTTRPMGTWVNSQNNLGLGAGVYFFDTTNGTNPQIYPNGNATRNALLTPAESWNSSDFGQLGAPSFLMQGFIYTNSSSFGTTGQGNNGTTVQANFPGEPFRDIGYPIWCTAAGTPIPQCAAANVWADCGNGISCRSGAGDGTFSCQDLNGNGKCDIVVMPAPTFYSDDPNPVMKTTPYTYPVTCGSGCTSGRTVYVVKTWKSPAQATADYGAPCTVPAATYNGTNPAATDCSEPHEPYLNIIYPDQAANNNGAPYSVVVGWEPPGSQTVRSKKIDAAGNPISCAACCVWPSAAQGDNEGDCNTNAYDVDGAVVPLSVILQGILYVEGQWGSEGNAWFFGSILVQDTINLSSGTADVWFDEKLLKGTWAPPGMPRVIVFSEQTDETSQ